ncbi:serine/threonine-protein kinase [Streptomyces sp. NEAU-W12]|uniref:serine/threonine-protein kinase n=1 Tax=Streptomyces sp. NEAU-W12 TaxID=2994668 RepID=UPI00224B89CD|nr:serine/threonine-protein kinase [Streptomyces sp. NEAU-W12]MCX2924822.1 protein kinase [Streptomyces sp. NEAU-W12]
MALRASSSGAGRVVAGRYVLLHRLGRGGTGHVWLAHDQRLTCEVVLKEIVSDDPAGPGQEREPRVARARAEVRHAAGLRDHPHVVTVHDVVEHEGLPWVVMEYVAGAVNLRELVARRGALAPAECARVGLAVLDALTTGHERGVLHRDVKPANILLAPDRASAPYGRVLLTDYGISVRPGTGEPRHTSASGVVGTEGWPAPERATGSPATPAADLFSLGCTLYHGVEGRGPFERESPLASIAAVVTEEPHRPVRAGALGPVLRGLLEKDPRRRTSARVLEAELSRLVTPESQSYARPPTGLGSQPPWAAPAPPAGTTAPAGAAEDVAPAGRTAPAPAHQRPRRPVPRAAAAVGLGVLLALGGAWYALAGRTDDGRATAPYGDAVGLAEPLERGDCVRAVWPGGRRFAGVPRLSVEPACAGAAGREVDGQVMGFVGAASAEEARELGPARCEEATREFRGRMAAVRPLAVVPVPEGFEETGRRTACLVLGARGPVYGPLGDRRPYGTAIADIVSMQRRDCLDTRPGRRALLVPCGGRYEEQVLGFTRLGEEVTLTEARALADTACARDVPPRDYGFDPSVHEAGAWTGELSWDTGLHVVVCTVKRQNGGTMEGTEP